MNLFSCKPSLMKQWLNAKGYSGSLNDAFNNYIQSGSTLTRGSVEDHLANRLYAAGYSGILEDMLTTMFISNTTKSNRADAEREFFQDSTKDMFGAGGESGNIFTDTDNNTVTDTSSNIVRDTE